MFSKFKDKILGLSSSYTFYKTEYEKLSSKCELLEEENAFLKDEIKSILVSQQSSIDSLGSSFDEKFNQLVSDNEKLLDALISFRFHYDKKVDVNRQLLEDLSDSSLRVEKTSSYINIKMDSKFDEYERFLENKLNSEDD